MKNKLKKIVLPLSVIGMLAIGSTSVFASEAINFNESNDIIFYDISYNQEDIKLPENRTTQTYTIKMTEDMNHGKAHVYNGTNSTMTFKVVGEETKTVKPYSSEEIEWEFKPGFFQKEKSYDVIITANEGFLKGRFSLAKATDPAEFQ